jgi:hypothetical protein
MNVRSILLTALLSLTLPLEATAGIRLDLQLPGAARSFDLRWSVGDGEQVAGIATDDSGSIYTTIGGDLVALSADGVERWRVACPGGGCSEVAMNGDAVFGSFFLGGMVRVSPETGAVQCSYLPGDLGTNAYNRQITASASFVAIAHIPWGTFPGALTVLDAATCTERYRLASPNGQRPNHPVLDEGSNALFVAWDDSGLVAQPAETYQYALDTGARGCKLPTPAGIPVTADENLRNLLVGGRYLALLSGAVCVFDASSCSAQGCFYPVTREAGIGDLRDVGFDAARDRFYVLGNAFTDFGFDVLKASTLKPLALYDEFLPNGLLSLNKFALGGRWAFISDGAPNEPGQFHVLDLERVQQGSFARFERGRVNRLGARLIDGGLLLTMNQRPNDTPLMAFDVGDGAFVGRADALGGPNGNKYCDACLTQLRYLEAACDDAPGGYACTLTNHYEFPISNPTLVLPWGDWAVRDAAGTPLPINDGEVVVPTTLTAGASTNVTVSGDVFLLAGKLLRINDPPGRPDKRLVLLKARNGVRVPARGSSDPTQVGGTIRLIGPNPGPSPDVTIELPSDGWQARGRDGYRFRSPGSPCRVSVRPGSLDVRCDGAAVGYSFGSGPAIPIKVRVTIGARPQLCLMFGGTLRGRFGSLSLVDAPAPEDCALP